jgi:hypothetical protein
MLADVDFLAPNQPRLHLLGKHGGSSEATDQLLTRLGTLLSPGLVGQDHVGNIPVTPIERAAAVNVAQKVVAVGDAGSAVARQSG